MDPEIRAWLDVAASIVTLILVPAAWKGLSLLLSMRDELRTIKHDMYGVDGKNGQRGAMRILETRVDAHGERLAAHDSRIMYLEREVNR